MVQCRFTFDLGTEPGQLYLPASTLYAKPCKSSSGSSSTLNTQAWEWYHSTSPILLLLLLLLAYSWLFIDRTAWRDDRKWEESEGGWRAAKSGFKPWARSWATWPPRHYILYKKANFPNYQTILGIISLVTSLFLENREYYIKYPYLLKYSASVWGVSVEPSTPLTRTDWNMCTSLHVTILLEHVVPAS